MYKKIVVVGLKGLPAYGGAASVGENIINQLKGKYHFTVLCTASHTSIKSGVYDNVKIVVLKNHGSLGVNTFLYYLKCLIHVVLNKYDFVHLHHAESGFITPFLRLKYRVIVTFHGIFNKIDPKFGLFTNQFFKLSQYLNIIFANKVISVSKPDSEFLSRYISQKVAYIPNGYYNHTKLKVRPYDCKDYIIFAAGRIYDIKGLHLILEALKMIDIKVPMLYIVGDIDQVGGYKEKIIEKSKGLNIKFHGLIKDKSSLLSLISGAKFFIFPSLTEAMSMMLLEVVSVGVPVIASNIPANQSIFSSKELLFFQSKCPYDLSKKIIYGLNHEFEMRQKAKYAKSNLEKNYSWEKISSMYAKYYEIM